MIQALVDLNIIHIPKYYDFIHVEHRLYFKVIKDFVAQRYAEMTYLERFKYRMWKRAGNGFEVGTKRSGLPILPGRMFLKDHVHWVKRNDLHEFGELYYMNLATKN